MKLWYITVTCRLCTWNGPQRLRKKKTGGIGNQRKNGENPDDKIDKIGSNTEKSRQRDLRRFVVSQTPIPPPTNPGVKNSLGVE